MLAINRSITASGPVPQLIVAQTAGLAIACCLALFGGTGRSVWMLLLVMPVQAMVAAVTARMIGMSLPWVVFNLLFAPAVLVALQLDVDPLVYATGFVVLLGVYGTATVANRVPLFLTGKRALAKLEPWLPSGPFSMIDLGAGTGRVLRFVAERRSNVRLTGTEVAPLPFLAAWLRSLSGRYTVSFDDFWNCDLSRYDVVYAYLSPAPMERLWDKARREMRSGSLFISNSFVVPGVPPSSVARYGSSRGATLYVWRMP